MKKFFVTLAVLFLAFESHSQIANTANETLDYREVDGKIIIELIVSGIKADFVLDLAGHCAILPECAAQLKIDTTDKTAFNGYTTYLHKKVDVSGACFVKNLSLGNNVFMQEAKFFILKDEPYLRELGVSGVVNAQIFRDKVLTIDRRRKKITTTAPYRPLYMNLGNRCSMTSEKGQAVCFEVLVGGKPLKVALDTWNQSTVVLCNADFERISQGQTVTKSGVTSFGYAKNVSDARAFSTDLKFINSSFGDVILVENSSIPYSFVGLDFLNNDIISIDFSKNKIYFQAYEKTEIEDAKSANVVIESGKLNPINRDWFIDNVYNYKEGGEFVSKYSKPIVIDFWATWCGPCMKLIPQMQAWAAKYKDKVVFVKVDADKEKELCNTFDIQALPTLFFIKPGEKPIIEIGATPEKYLKLIEKLIE